MQARHVVVVAAMVAAAGGVGFVLVCLVDDSARIDDTIPDAPGAAPTPTPPLAVEDPRPASPVRRHVDDPTTVADRAAAPERAKDERRARAFVAENGDGDTPALLRSLRGSGAHPFELVGSPESFGAPFERKTNGPSIDGPALIKKSGPIADGSTITFPGGLHDWRFSHTRVGPFPEDLLVVGAGMDKTIVRLDELSARDAVRSLTFRDVTIDCGNEYFCDLSDAVTLRFERCRVVGFDMGAGGSVMLSAGSAAFFASDSRFETGFSRTTPGFGNLFRVGSGLLARMQGCVFVGPFRSVYEENSASTFDFVDCKFQNFEKDFAPRLAAPPDGVRFENCSVADVDPAELVVARVALLADVAAASGGTTDVFSLLKTYRLELSRVVADRPTFAAMFAPPNRDAAGATTDDATVSFRAGAFSWDTRGGSPAADGGLVLAGQGMDATLVRLQGQLNVRRLTLRDLTLDVGNHGELRDDASRLTTIRIERCRLVGYDTGAGGSTLFDWRGPALILAEDSRFEAGYGHGAPRGRLLQGGKYAAARFERCAFRVFGDVESVESGARGTVVFKQCRFLDVAPNARARFDSPAMRAVLNDSSVEYAADGKGGTDLPLTLADVNPAWGDGRRK